MSLPLSPNLTFICFYLVYHEEDAADDVVRIVMSFWFGIEKYGTLPLLLTVDNHIDIFDIWRGDVVAGLTFIATCLISHNAYDVQILISIQRLCCKTKKE